jgi:hypothetical protein
LCPTPKRLAREAQVRAARDREAQAAGQTKARPRVDRLPVGPIKAARTAVVKTMARALVLKETKRIMLLPAPEPRVANARPVKTKAATPPRQTRTSR